MIITVDCNNDIVTMNNGGRPVECEVKHPMLVIAMLNELLNMLAPMTEDGITLEKIDENHRTIVDEW